MLTTRRRFLSFLGLGAAAVGVELVAPEPARRIWQVGRNAPLPEQPLFRPATPAETAALWAEHGAIYDNTNTLFGIDAGTYREWKAARYDGADAGMPWEQLVEWQRRQGSNGLKRDDILRALGARRRAGHYVGSRAHHFGDGPEPVLDLSGTQCATHMEAERERARAMGDAMAEFDANARVMIREVKTRAELALMYERRSVRMVDILTADET